MPTTPFQRTITYTRVVHLSHPIDPDIPLWEGDPPVEFEEIAQLDPDGYYLRRFSMGEHSATHMNAPNSFFADAPGIDAYPAESLVISAVVIDAQTQSAINPDYCLSIDDILHWESEHGQIAEQSVVLLHTGWQTIWNNPTLFLNRDRGGLYHFPGFSGEVTQFLLVEREIAGVGSDTHGVDGNDTTYATNRQVLANQGIVLENLANLDQLPPVGTTLVIGVLRLRQGSGAPVSVLALVP